MDRFNIRIRGFDAPEVIEATLAPIDGFKAPRYKWVAMLRAIGINLGPAHSNNAPISSPREAAWDICCSAFAGIQFQPRFECDQNYVTFTTPNGVTVEIFREPGSSANEVQLHLVFGPNSDPIRLVPLVLANLFYAMPKERTAFLLCEAAGNAVRHYANDEGDDDYFEELDDVDYSYDIFDDEDDVDDPGVFDDDKDYGDPGDCDYGR